MTNLAVSHRIAEKLSFILSGGILGYFLWIIILLILKLFDPQTYGPKTLKDEILDKCPNEFVAGDRHFEECPDCMRALSELND